MTSLLAEKARLEKELEVVRLNEAIADLKQRLAHSFRNKEELVGPSGKDEVKKSS